MFRTLLLLFRPRWGAEYCDERVCLCVCVCVCGPLRRYKDTVKTNMKRCGPRPQSLSTAPLDRAPWRTTCQSATASFEESRVAQPDRKRAARKQQVINTTGTVWPCDRCSRRPAHHGLGSSPIGAPFGDDALFFFAFLSYSTVHSMCVCVCVCVHDMWNTTDRAQRRHDCPRTLAISLP